MKRFLIALLLPLLLLSSCIKEPHSSSGTALRSTYLYVTDQVEGGILGVSSIEFTEDSLDYLTVYLLTDKVFSEGTILVIDYTAENFTDEAGSITDSALNKQHYDAKISSAVSIAVSTEAKPYYDGDSWHTPGCSCVGRTDPVTTGPSDSAVDYLYITAFTEDGFLAGGTIRTDDGKQATVYVLMDGADEHFSICQTVRLEYTPSMLMNEPGSVLAFVPDQADQGDSLPSGMTPYDKKLTSYLSIRRSDPSMDEPLFDKPVIYLYPEKETLVDVKVDFKGTFTVTIPDYRDGWTVTASPDGTLTDSDGNTYPYLFWEGIPTTLPTITEGFCIAGEDTEIFLTEALTTLGLNARERADFLAYWLPLLEGNTYNILSFLGEEYTAMAPITVSPAPDSLLRVFLLVSPAEAPVTLPTQTLIPLERHGFTVVEWGGCLLPATTP